MASGLFKRIFHEKCVTRNASWYLCASLVRWNGPTAVFPEPLKVNLTAAQTSRANAREVAFIVIFMAHIEKQLRGISPQKPLIWKRFTERIFSVDITQSRDKQFQFMDFANSFPATIKFTDVMSSENIVFLDIEIYKGPRFLTGKILDVQTHFKRTETFQYTHFRRVMSPSHREEGLCKRKSFALT